MVVVMMVMMVVVMTGHVGRRRNGSRSRSRCGILAGDLVEHARHGISGAGGDRADTISDSRHGAGHRVLSHGELRGGKSGRKTDNRSDSNFLHDRLSVNLPDSIVDDPKIISPSGKVHRCSGNARIVSCSGHWIFQKTQNLIRHRVQIVIRSGGKNMKKTLIFGTKSPAALLVIALQAALTPQIGVAKTFSAFRCERLEGGGEVGGFNWWGYDYSGFRWISCIVEAPVVRIEAIRLNRGNCGVLDTWFIDRTFTAGQRLDISHACLSPVMLEIDSNGRTSVIPLQ